MIYIVCWSGGYDAPQYAAFNSIEKAFATAEEWSCEMEEGIDTIDVISLDEVTLAMERVYEKTGV